jgi:hypothetical protein
VSYFRTEFGLIVSGYLMGMVDTADQCALPPCRRHADVKVRMLVNGQESVMDTCRSHAQWLRGYVEEDADVRLLDMVPEEEGR